MVGSGDRNGGRVSGFYKNHGKANDADHTGAEQHIQTILPEMLRDFKACDTFKVDESGLFYKALPSGTLAKAGEKIVGGKIQKARLTSVFLCNADGSFTKVFASERR